jgi:hypothetical protein
LPNASDVTITAVDKLAVARFPSGETIEFADLASPTYDGWVREESPSASYQTTLTIPAGAANMLRLQSPTIANLTASCRADPTAPPTVATVQTPTEGDDVEDAVVVLPTGPQFCDVTAEAVYEGGSIKLSVTP